MTQGYAALFFLTHWLGARAPKKPCEGTQSSAMRHDQARRAPVTSGAARLQDRRVR
jgi:hypothetical protein